MEERDITIVLDKRMYIEEASIWIDGNLKAIVQGITGIEKIKNSGYNGYSLRIKGKHICTVFDVKEIKEEW